jgi:hypothetical protein
MQVQSFEYQFRDGRVITITQENWEIGTRLSVLRQNAKEQLTGDARVDYFRQNFWPLLSAGASGQMPTVDEAYAMLETDPEQIDDWYKFTQSVSPDWFVIKHHNDPKDVVFTDGSKLTVIDANIPSVIMKLFDLEAEANANPHTDLNKQVFRMSFYVRMKACSIGNVPTEDEARTWRSSETDKWYQAVNQVNPHFFEQLIALQEKLQEPIDLKKNKLMHQQSGNG